MELTKELQAALLERGDFKVKQRPGQGGRKLDYIEARAVMDRLDAVVGLTNWSDTYRVIDEKSYAVECTLTVCGITKVDVGYCNNPASPEAEAYKSAYSDAFKRAAVKFGIGRFLYDERYETVGNHLLDEALKQGARPLAAPVADNRTPQEKALEADYAANHEIKGEPPNPGLIPGAKLTGQMDKWKNAIWSVTGPEGTIEYVVKDPPNLTKPYLASVATCDRQGCPSAGKSWNADPNARPLVFAHGPKNAKCTLMTVTV